MLSDQEYVIKASSARKLGRGVLDWLNSGNFAKGGHVARLAGGGGLSPEWFDPDLTPEESINLLNETVLSPQQLKLVALNNAKTPEESIKLLNRFIMHRAGGGPVGHFASGGVANFGDSIGHLFSGGVPDMPSLGDLNSSSGASLGHYTVDLNMGGSTFRMMSSEETAKQMGAYARDSANFQTGPAPGWAHGSR